MAKRLVAVLAMGLLACTPGTATVAEDGQGPEALLKDSAELLATPADWFDSGSLHGGEPREFALSAQASRRVFYFYVAGSATLPPTSMVSARGSAGLKLAVYGPRTATGSWPLLASAGYSSALSQPSVNVRLKSTGRYRVVVQPFQAGRDVRGTVSFFCLEGSCENKEAFVSPRSGALLSSRTLEAQLHSSLCGRPVEVWASRPPLQLGRRRVDTVTPSGCQLRLLLPSWVTEGDDLTLVLPGVESGLTVRLSTSGKPQAFLQAVTLGDTWHFHLSGVVPSFEGLASLRLVNETQGKVIGSADAYSLKPGQATLGLASFATSLEVPQDRLPAPTDVLSFGHVDMMPEYRKVACFRPCAPGTACDWAPGPCP